MERDDIVSQLLPIIQQIVGSVLKLGGSGVFGRMKEAGSLMDYFGRATTQFTGNDIIEELLRKMMSTEEDADMPRTDLNELDPQLALDEAGHIETLLASFGPGVTQQIKEFIFGAADAVAGAAGTGLFGSGDKVTPEEQQFLSQLKSKLGL